MTPELKQRLKENLIFGPEGSEDAVGAFTILFRNETKESAEELFQALRELTQTVL